MTVPMTSLTQAPDGTTLAYQSQGAGPVLLLLAGQANNHHWWDDIRDDFAGQRRTITVDYRGTGDSGKPESHYSTELFADDVIAVLDHAGTERADIYGTSMGGRVAQVIASRHPDRVRHLILGCTSPGGPHSVERDNTVRRALANSDRAAATEALLGMMYSPEWLSTHPGPYTVLGDPSMPPHAQRGHLMASNRHNAWDLLPLITAPTLILHGADDVLNPVANAPLLAKRIPDATMTILPGARHAYFQEMRESASSIVLDFL